MADSTEVIVGTIGLSFAQALVEGDFKAAHELLSEPLKVEWPPSRLEEALISMVAYGDGPPDKIELISFDDMHTWPTRQCADLGWAYVAICGDGFNEAVSVVVATDGGRHVIRDVEWGRP
ncbi:MAG TPA: hypothetical protein VFD58_09590 [Blastocatellia bacterium]|nr:hypothetical protein [Blastocatellia bacterium]